MSLLIQYLVKLSISLAIVWLFYQFVLRKLTFYNSNRWYLAGYTLLSFIIPFINISPVLENNRVAGNGIVQFIPSVQQYTTALEEATHGPVPIWSTNYDKWDWIAFGLMAGAAVFLLRFVIRCIAFFRMRRKAKLISANGVRLCQVDDHIIPFSFGNAVFINSELHTEAELQEIMSHEFVHVKQKHTADIIWSEWLCIINWYNPFAWLLKASIRQNLEFIADNKVLENGVNKKQYQYLLLKVIGNNQFSIASKFNFSSLKKRIAMMNRLKSARLHLVRFLFILPLLAVILISFRKPNSYSITQDKNKEPAIVISSDFTDTVPEIMELNDKGYYINVKGNDGNCIVMVNDKNRKEVARVLLTKWKENQKYYDNLYGEILPHPPPPPPVEPVPPMLPMPPIDKENPDLKIFLKRNADVKDIGRVYNNVNENTVIEAHIFKKDGTIEKYDLKDAADKARMEKKYGKLPEPPPPPISAIAPTAPTPPAEPAELQETEESNITRVSKEFEITNDKAVIKLKNGTTEKYDLKNPEQRADFEKKYGRIVNTHVNTSIDMAPVRIINGGHGQTVIAPVAVSSSADVLVVDDYGHAITGHEDVLVTITSKTTPDQLEEFKKKMKEKGIDLKFDNIDYNDGKLVSISGSMKSKDGQSNFNASDFSKLILAMIKDGDRTYFKVNVTDTKVEI